MVSGWQMQFAAKVSGTAEQISSAGFSSVGWYRATVPGTVLSTLVDNKVYADPMFGENMRRIPESLNQQSYWYRAAVDVPAAFRGGHCWLEFGGVNYSAEIWVNGHHTGQMRGAFRRGEFDITTWVQTGASAVIAVLVSPQPHPGVPHEHTQANGMGHNGGVTALDGPSFLSTIGWDWLPAIPDRDTGIWLPVTLRASGAVRVRDPYVTSELTENYTHAALHVAATLDNGGDAPVPGELVGTITGDGRTISFRVPATAAPGASVLQLDPATVEALTVDHPKLWWPNGYGEPNLYTLALQFVAGDTLSDSETTQFGIREVKYEAPGSDNLTIVVNGVKVMVRGGNWGLDDAMKRLSPERMDAQFHLHALAHLNLIRNWVGQSTSPEFYRLADKYGIMLWDEFFQPNPSDGPNVEDVPTYLANVRDKVLHYRSHPSIVVWCARNEGFPPPALDEALGKMMKELDPSRLYQSSSTEGRGVSSHGPYHWRSPQLFYPITEAFKTETGSVSIPTLESVQGMMPKKDWEHFNDDWAEHDLAAGAQRGDQYGAGLARRYGPVRNLADFVRKAQLANYEAFRAMYEARNSEMFTTATGVITWMSHPAHPSFVWQLYSYDLEPNASLYATMKASEPVHIQMNEADHTVEVVNNLPAALAGVQIHQTVYEVDGRTTEPIVVKLDVPASMTRKAYTLSADPMKSDIYFVKLELMDSAGKLLSTNFYWENATQDDFRLLETMPPVTLNVSASQTVQDGKALITVQLENPTTHIALMTHLQLHRKSDGQRVLPAFASDNYLSLAPGETRTVTIEAAAADVASGAIVLVDGYNVTVQSNTTGGVEVRANENAMPEHSRASKLVRGAKEREKE